MSSLKNKVEHRLMRSLSDFRLLRAEAEYEVDKVAMDELLLRQLQLLEWAMENMPVRTKAKPEKDGVF